MHEIERDLDDDSIERWAADGIAFLERLLASYAAFQAYLVTRDLT
jgi:hypothetical protein